MTNENELDGLHKLQRERKNEHYTQTSSTTQVVRATIVLLVVSLAFNIYTVMQLKKSENTATKYKGRQIFYRALINNHAVGGGHKIHYELSDKNRTRLEQWSRRDAQRLVTIWDARDFRVPWSEKKLSLDELAIVGEGPFFDELRTLLGVPAAPVTALVIGAATCSVCAGLGHGVCREHGKR